jgi:hypothetical protein
VKIVNLFGKPEPLFLEGTGLLEENFLCERIKWNNEGNLAKRMSNVRKNGILLD